MQGTTWRGSLVRCRPVGVRALPQPLLGGETWQLVKAEAKDPETVAMRTITSLQGVAVDTPPSLCGKVW